MTKQIRHTSDSLGVDFLDSRVNQTEIAVLIRQSKALTDRIPKRIVSLSAQLIHARFPSDAGGDAR